MSLAAVAILMFVAGFIVPPMGVIDGSVLKAGGEIMGFNALLVFAYMVASGHHATFTRGNTSIEVDAAKPKTDDEGNHLA